MSGTCAKDRVSVGQPPRAGSGVSGRQGVAFRQPRWVSVYFTITQGGRQLSAAEPKGCWFGYLVEKVRICARKGQGLLGYAPTTRVAAKTNWRGTARCRSKWGTGCRSNAHNRRGAIGVDVGEGTFRIRVDPLGGVGISQEIRVEWP